MHSLRISKLEMERFVVMRRVRVIQVGTAPMVHAAHLATALKGLPEEFEVLGIVEEDPALRVAAEKKPEIFGFPFLTWEEAVALRPDAVMVETDEFQLVRAATRSLRAGFHTYMDKPGSGDSAQFHRMCELAREKQLVLNLGYMFRENPAIRRALELKEQGVLGEIFSVEAQMSCCNGRNYYETLARFQGGIMYYLGCHMIDVMVHFCGFPERVVPLNSKTRLRGVDAVDYGFCAYQYANGVSFVKTAAAEVNGVNRRSVIITGSLGSVEIRPIEIPRGDGFDDTIMYVTLDNNKPFTDGRCEIKFPPHRRYDRLLRNFAAYVRGEKSNPHTPEYEARLHDLVLRSCE